MSSTDDLPQDAPPFSIQNIFSKLKTLTEDCVAKVDPPKKTTDGTNATEADNGGTKNKAKDGEGKKRQKEVKIDDDGRMKALHELEKLCKELEYMVRSLQRLEEFENNLKETLTTLEDNVNDIVNDLGKPELPKVQVHNKLRALRNNITNVKFRIPVQYETASLDSEGTRGLQTTVATGDAGDLPHLYGEDMFEESYYFKEVAEKYEGLDTRHKLRLLCFAIFPENAEISKRLLRFWWVGENLMPQQEEGKDERGVLNDTLNTYVKMGFIEPVPKQKKAYNSLPRSYKMNPFVRSCVTKFAKHACFFDYDQEGKPIMDFSSCNKACMVKPKGAASTPEWLSDYLKGNQKLDLVKLQMLFNFPDRDTLIKARKQIDKLQTLFNLSKQHPDLPTEWFSKMTGLKVLYLGKWETEASRPRYIGVESIHFLKGLENMKNLRLLSLQGISGIPKIPSTLGKLENLRILDLRACHNLEKLPDTIGSLKKLTYLDLSECYLLDRMPKRLNQLSELQVLKGFVIMNARNSCTLMELSELENLRKLSIYVNTTKFDIDGEEKALSKFKKLKKLRIVWGSTGMLKEGSTQRASSQQQNAGQRKNVRLKRAANVILAVIRLTLLARERKQKNLQQQNDASKRAANEFLLAHKLMLQEAESKRNYSLKKTANKVLAANKLMSLSKMKKPRGFVGLEKLVKLDLECFPRSAPPEWLRPRKMASLRNLSIRGGKLGHLNHEGTMWEVDTLRLMSLIDFKMNWKEMQVHFPRLKYLDIERSPRITFCPCHANGVLLSSSN